MSTTASRSVLRPLALLLSLLLAISGLTLPALAAHAAPGDVAAATLQWGVKASFRSYLTGPIAHGRWIADGVSDATPFGWSGGAGAAPDGAGTVAYPGGLRFQGHQGFGVGAEEYALDLAFSDVTVRVTGATTGELVLDARSRGLSDPTTFVELDDVVFATLDLAGGTDVSTDAAVAYSGVPATLTADGATAFAGFYSAGTVLDPVTFSWPVEAAPEPVTPTIVVSDTTDLRSGDVVTVTGTGFGPDETGGPLGTRPPLAGEFAGVYVVFGTFLDTWQPSAGAPSSSRKAGPNATRWVVSPDDVASVGGAAAGAVPIAADGSFEVQLTVTEDFAGALADGSYGIYTYAGSGAAYAPFETATPITFAAPVPTITVSQTEGLESGDVVTVMGRNFGPDETGGPLGTRPPLAGKFAGVYVTFGTFLDAWQPSAGAPSSARRAGPDATKWVMNPEDAAAIAGAVPIAADGSFEVRIPVTEDFAGALADGRYGIYTYAGSGAAYAPFETFTPVAFAAGETSTALTATPDGSVVAGTPVTLAATVTPAAAGTVRFSDGPTALGEIEVAAGSAQLVVTPAVGEHAFRAEFVPADAAEHASSLSPVVALTVTAPVPAAAGSLTWGVKASFRSYVLGDIAHGTIASAGGASPVPGGYLFPQSAASVDGSGLGAASYRGSVTFTGHAGALSLRIADPIVRITSASAAVLSVSTSTGRVDMAALDLARAARTTGGGGAVTYTAAPATLTSAGAASFAGFYAAGEALDPVTFTVGSNNPANGAGSVAGGSAATLRSPAPTPPASEGIASTDETFVEGGEYTFTASGFEPEETGVLVVAYSTPTVLATDATADAAGVVTWTGSLPAGLTGRHTLTFQGSVDRGIVLQIAAADPVGCTVDDASLSWGFKESFRAYIDGSIANGEWTTSDGAAYETPRFGWANGVGGYDAATGDADLAFTGAVRFTGHGGVLDTTIANPRVVIEGDRAVLLLDVTGTTQAGEPVAQTGVEFAELDLAAAEPGGGGDLVAFTGIPATLTAAGAAAFGTYPEGEALDPVDLTITVDPACALPAVDDEQPLAATGTVSAEAPVWPWLVGAIALLLAVAAVAAVLVRRARRAG